MLTNDFLLASESDEALGERVIMVLEANSNSLDAKVFDGLDKYEVPRQIYAVSQFVETASGKIQRLKTLDLIK